MAFFLYIKGFREIYVRCWAFWIISLIFLGNIMILQCPDSKIGGTFIGMPSKGRSDTLHECKGCLVRQ